MCRWRSRRRGICVCAHHSRDNAQALHTSFYSPISLRIFSKHILVAQFFWCPSKEHDGELRSLRWNISTFSITSNANTPVQTTKQHVKKIKHAMKVNIKDFVMHLSKTLFLKRVQPYEFWRADAYWGTGVYFKTSWKWCKLYDKHWNCVAQHFFIRKLW